MATQAQIDANRRNAAKSTGPRTADGKRIVTNNALKHGLCSDEALIPGEDAEVFADFADDLRLHMEEDDRSLRNVMLIERVILIRWKLRRLPRLERLAMNKLVEEHGDGDEAMLAGLVGDPQSATLAKLQMYEMRLNRELRACMNEFRKEFNSLTHTDCHKAYCEGYNRGVRDQADWASREPAIPPMAPPERSLEAVDEEPEEPTETVVEQSQSEPNVTACHIGGDLTEQSQFASNERPEQELAMSGDVAADAEASLAALPTRSRHAEGAAA